MPGDPNPVTAQLSEAGFDDAQLVGRGGFGIVYRCTQVELDRVVAVKVLTALLDDNRARFVREQRAMAKLTGHPNIVVVLQVGETRSGLPYLVMPYFSRGCLDGQIRRGEALSLEQTLRMGVQVAGALVCAHRSGIVHRDVKPANVLLTDYGEHALTDFGISHMAGSFKTAAGLFIGSPSYTPPEVVLGREAAHPADVYGLAATMFCALTGHSPFEPRTEEQLVAQLMRIATEPMPDLSEHGVPQDVAEVVGSAMAREPGDRPSAAAFADQLADLQSRHGSGDHEVVRGGGSSARRSERTGALGPVCRSRGSLPAPLDGFVGRGAELSQLQELLSTSRLVTILGVGGVGKTMLALQAANRELPSLADGVWWIELAEVRDGALLTEVVASKLGVRDQAGRSLTDVVVEVFAERHALLVFDNCEHIIDRVAELAETLLRGCTRVQILATSREVLRIGGESLLALSPLPYPGTDSTPAPADLAGYDAVVLFVQRAQAVSPSFRLTEHNATVVARICSRLDGLPLAIELATARLRAMSVEQIDERLRDRFAFLTRGKRSASTRQQTLNCCIAWSYERCTPAEQRLWAELSVFAGTFDLDAAQAICGEDSCADDLLDELCALVDKSILVQIDRDGVARFRLLETLREFGKAHVGTPEDHRRLQRRHLDWYHRLLSQASSEWFGEHQLRWLDRISGEMPNIREAMQCAVAESPPIALEMGTGIGLFCIARGMLGEARRWLDLALSAAPVEATGPRVAALGSAAFVACMQVDVPTATARAAQARQLLDAVTDPRVAGMIDFVDGFASFLRGEIDRARACTERAVTTDDFEVRAESMILLGWILDISGELDHAVSWLEKAVALAESRGESLIRAGALSSLGVRYWRKGEITRATRALRECLQLAQLAGDHYLGAQCLEALAWVAESNHDPRRAATLIAAASAVSKATGAGTTLFAMVGGFHDDCERRIRDQLGPVEFQAATVEGRALSFEKAAAMALETCG